MARSNTRDRIVRAAAGLLRRRGYAATGLADIIAESEAPKGSLYHYFPRGKDEIAAAAVRYASDKVAATLCDLAANATAAHLMRAYGEKLAGWMARSGFEDGCPITTTLLETTPRNKEIAEEGRCAFAAWMDIIQRRLMADGVAPPRAEALARFALMTIEGALLFARVEASGAAISSAVEEVARMFERECVKIPCSAE